MCPPAVKTVIYTQYRNKTSLQVRQYVPIMVMFGYHGGGRTRRSAPTRFIRVGKQPVQHWPNGQEKH